MTKATSVSRSSRVAGSTRASSLIAISSFSINVILYHREEAGESRGFASIATACVMNGFIGRAWLALFKIGCSLPFLQADVAELVDATDSKSVFFGSVGSSPTVGIFSLSVFPEDKAEKCDVAVDVVD